MRSDHEDHEDHDEREEDDEPSPDSARYLIGRHARCFYAAAAVIVFGCWTVTWAHTVMVAWMLGVNYLSPAMTVYRIVVYLLLLYALAWQQPSVVLRLTRWFVAARR